ncbi:MAG: hypothetical protein NVSMB52_10170 [Chloroflexota bacterium]
MTPWYGKVHYANTNTVKPHLYHIDGGYTMSRRVFPAIAGIITLLSLFLPPTVLQSAASGVGMRARVHFSSTYEGGVAVLGSRYAYVGTSTANRLHIVDTRNLHPVAHWRLPALGNGINYGMERLVLSPDNRRLFLMNGIRSDLVVVDTTGKVAPRSINLYTQHNGIPTDLKISADGRVLYVSGGEGIDMYNAGTGSYLGRVPRADAVAPSGDGSIYYLTIRRGHASLHVATESGTHRRTIASYSGNPLSDLNGDIAVSRDGQRVYALWDSFRAYDTRSHRLIGAVSLPLVPHFRGIALAPNGQQAMLWSPNFSGLYSTPGLNPSYVTLHYGFIAGGILPVDLLHMRPIGAHLEAITTPHQVAYTSDSRLAFVTGLRELDVISTGTAGADGAHIPAISLKGPGKAPKGPGSGPGPGLGKSAGTCNVSGSWSFITSAAGAGPGSGSATLQQSGTSVTGTLTSSVGWALSGAIHGKVLTLTMHAAGQIDLSYSGTVSTSGTSIAGNLGNFTSGHAKCQ